MTTTPDRYLRQNELIPPLQLNKVKVSVIGIGAIGRQIALQLASLGSRHVQLIDFDTIEPTNITTQGYLQEDLDREKVKVTADQMRKIDPSIEVSTIVDRYRPQQKLGEVIFCCVDSISSRSAIWKSVKDQCLFWCDGRMLGEVIRILVVNDHQSKVHYPTTLFPQADAQNGSCTSQSTIYAASIAAGLMIHQYARWLRGIKIDFDVSLNLLASELTSVS
ncbi:MAG TPA: thiamine biosynthesis protein ThiF [Planctomycetaceae bacterium]|nr:thiamine biosynthesis protein ThiF [Planctomycetaceae bacterium]